MITNDEWRMTKEMQMTNGEKHKGLSRGVSLFGFRHSSRIRHLLFVIFPRVVLILAVAVAISCSGKRITKENVDQVTDGMSKKQVESILGPPTSRTIDVYVYRQGKDTVAIVFKGDKVQSKKSTLSD